MLQQLVAFQQSLKWTFRGLFNMGVPCYRLRCPACLSETPSSKSSSSVLAKERLTKAPGKRDGLASDAERKRMMLPGTAAKIMPQNGGREKSQWKQTILRCPSTASRHSVSQGLLESTAQQKQAARKHLRALLTAT